MVESQPGTVQTFDPVVSLSNFGATKRDHLIFNENQLVLAKVQRTDPVFAYAYSVNDAANTTNGGVMSAFLEYKNLDGEFAYIDGSFQALNTPGVPTSSVHRISVGFDQQITTDTIQFWSVGFVDTNLIFVEHSFDNVTWFDTGAVTWNQAFDDTIKINPADEPPTGEFVYTGTIDGGAVTARYWRLRSDAQAEWLSGTGSTVTVDSTDGFPTTNAEVHVFDGQNITATKPYGTFKGVFSHTGLSATQFTGKSGFTAFSAEYQVVNLGDPFGDGVTEVRIIPTSDPILEHWNSDGTQAVTNAVEGEDYYHLAYDKNDDVYYAIRLNRDLRGTPPDPSDDFDALTGADFNEVLWDESLTEIYFVHNDTDGTLDYNNYAGPGRLSANVGIDGNFSSEVTVHARRLSSDNAYFSLESTDLDDGNQYMVSALKGAYGPVEDTVLKPGAAYLVDRDAGPVDWVQDGELTAFDPKTSQKFGSAVAMSSDVIVVGVPEDDEYGTNAGVVYVIDGVLGVTKLVGSDTVAGDFFGEVVAVNGSVLAVGAYRANNGAGASSGAVYVFERDGGGVWSQVQKLTPSSPSAGDEFGRAIVIEGNSIYVGSPRDDGPAFNAGKVFIYDKSGTWPATEDAEVFASDASSGDEFGSAIAVDGTRMIVSAPLDDAGGQNAGSIYVFDLAGSWVETKKVVGPGGQFGHVLGLDGDRFVAGAIGLGVYEHLKDEGGVDNWGGSLVDIDGAWPFTSEWDLSEMSLDLDGSTMVVGFPQTDAPETAVAHGRILIYDFNDASQPIQVFSADPSQAGAEFGKAVAVDATAVVAAAPRYSFAGLTSAGAVMKFTETDSRSNFWNYVSTPSAAGSTNNVFAASAAFTTGAKGAKTSASVGEAWAVDLLTDAVAALTVTSETLTIGTALLSAALYGTSIAVSEDGTVIAVGAPGQDNERGAVFIFEYTGTWNEVAKLQPVEVIEADVYDTGSQSARLKAGSLFGSRVQFSGNDRLMIRGPNTASAGVPSETKNLAFYFEKGGTWPAEATRVISGITTDTFTLGGDYLVDGTQVYKRNSSNGDWDFLQTLDSSGVVGSDGTVITTVSASGSSSVTVNVWELIASVWTKVAALSGSDWAYLVDHQGDSGEASVVACYSNRIAVSFGGVLYFFEKSGGTWQETEVTKAIYEPSTGDFYASGTGFYGEEKYTRGAVNLYEQVEKYVASLDRKDGHLGNSVDLSGSTVAAGAPGAPNGGAAFIYNTRESGLLVRGLDIITGDDFGTSVGLSTDTLAVGAPGKTTAAGSVYVFERNLGGANAWGEQAVVSGTGLVAGDDFGTSVSLDIDTLIVGAPGDASDAGTAYAFGRNVGGTNNWGQHVEITGASPSAGDAFGFSVAVEGDTAVVGAPSTSSSAGTAYIFERNNGGANNWGLTTELTDVTLNLGDDFGFSVAIEGDTVIVGAPGAGSDAGTAYVFERDSGGVDNWGQVAQLNSSTATAGNRFGVSVSVAQNTAVVGADSDDSAIGDGGAVYHFSRVNGTWSTTEETVVFSDEIDSGDSFGSAVATDASVLVVGARLDDKESIADAGTVFVFDREQVIDWIEDVKLVAADAKNGNVMGNAVAIHGATSVLGAERDNTLGDRAGAAYVFFGGTQSAKLYRVGGLANDRFGWDVDVYNNTVVIGAPGEQDDAGSVSVFEYSGSWSETVTVTGTGVIDNDDFGTAVGLDEDFLVVGAPGKLTELGAAFLFGRDQGGPDNWGQIKELTPADSLSLGDNLGWSIALGSGIAVVGAPGVDSDEGAVYVFERNTGGVDNWGQLAKLTATDTLAGDRFGHSVSVSGTYIAVGAPFHAVAGASDAGAVYIYEQSLGVWPTTQTQKITASDYKTGDQFGYSVSVADGQLAVGANRDQDVGTATGAVYLFERYSTWTQADKFLGSDTISGDSLGTDVALDVDKLLAGTYIYPTSLFDVNWVGATLEYSGDLAASADTQLTNFHIDPGAFDFSVSSQTVEITYDSGSDIYDVFLNGSSLGAALPGAEFSSSPVKFVVANLNPPGDGQQFLIDITAAGTAVSDPTTVSGLGLKLERVGTNGTISYREAGAPSYTTLFVGNVTTGYTHSAELAGDASSRDVDVSADDYVASGDTLVFNSPVFSIVTIDKSGNLVQIPSVSDSEGYVIKRLDLLQDPSAEYNSFLTPRVGVATNGLAVGSGGELYFKIRDKLYKYLKSVCPLDLEDGSNAAVITTGEVPDLGITAFAYNGYSQGGLSYIEYVSDLSGVFVKSIETIGMTAISQKALLDVTTQDYPFAWNVSDLSTLYYVDGTDLKLYDLNETKAAFVNVTSDKQVLAAGTQETATITAQVLNVYGEPKSNKTMTFSVSAGDGAISPAVGCSDVNGEDTTTYTVGSAVGTATVTVTVSDLAC